MTKDKSILIKNIYYMLSYAFQTLDQQTYESISTESFDEMYDLLAAILAKGIGIQLKHGLYKEYISKTEELSGLRGKISMSPSLKNKMANKRVITCEYDELSENNLLNQILKTTVLLLLRSSKVKGKYKNDLKKEMWFFSEVDTLNPMTVKWSSIRFQRNNRNYRMLIGICQLIIEGMLMTTEAGEYKLASFVDTQAMSRLYEKFILEYYRRHFPQLKPKSAQIEWALDDGMNELLPKMQSDIYLRKGNTVLIIDAKFYAKSLQSQYGSFSQQSSNIYQIFTYVKNCEYGFQDEPHSVSGMLLYAKTDEEIQPDQTYFMHGNQISVRTLDLNQPFNIIAEQLNQIAFENFGKEQ